MQPEKRTGRDNIEPAVKRKRLECRPCIGTVLYFVKEYESVPWDELDELSGREEAVTGKNPQYKAMDIANIKAIPEILKQIK